MDITGATGTGLKPNLRNIMQSGNSYHIFSTRKIYLYSVFYCA